MTSKLKQFAKSLKFLCILLLCTLLISEPTFAYLPEDDVIDIFDQNDIYYYNPAGNMCGVGSTQLVGDTDIEKIWNFYINQGFNDAQVAGILGNGITESGTSPSRSVDGSYIGLFQWYVGYNHELIERINAAGLGQYIGPEYWAAEADKKIPAAERDKLIEIELQYTMDGNNTEWIEPMRGATTPEEAAEVFLVHFERAVYVPAYANACSPIEYYGPYKGILYQGTKHRRQGARETYDNYAGKGKSVSGTSSNTENGKNITVIGDSISAGAKSHFFEAFPELEEAQFNARASRQWSEGVEIAKSITPKSIVIFALGSNSSNLSNHDIDAAISAIGNDKTIVFVTNYSTSSNVYDHNNELFKQYAKENSNIILADWESVAKTDPAKYMLEFDDSYEKVHPNQEGAKLFVETIKDALNGNVSANQCYNTVGEEFTNLVKAYAWPEYHHAPWTERMPAYAQAVEQSVSEGRYVGGFSGVDCGGFVTVLVQNSGLEPDYNKTAPGPGNTVSQKAWVKEHGWTLLNPNEGTPVDASILQAGDVAFSPGHTFIYVGEIDGFGSTIASASYGERAPMAGLEDTQTGNGGIVTWWRNPNIDLQRMTSTAATATGGNVGEIRNTNHNEGLEAKSYDGWNYYMYTPEQSNNSLIVFLHGSGEIGTEISRLKNAHCKRLQLQLLHSHAAASIRQLARRRQSGRQTPRLNRQNRRRVRHRPQPHPHRRLQYGRESAPRCR